MVTPASPSAHIPPILLLETSGYQIEANGTCYGVCKGFPSKMRPLKGFAGFGKQCALYVQSYANSFSAEEPRENTACIAVLAKKSSGHDYLFSS